MNLGGLRKRGGKSKRPSCAEATAGRRVATLRAALRARKCEISGERTRDSCDPKNERVRKSLKTRRDECEKLVTRASERRGEEDRGGVLNW